MTKKTSTIILAGLAAAVIGGITLAGKLEPGSIEPIPIEPIPTEAISVDPQMVQRVQDWLDGKREYVPVNEWPEIIKKYRAKEKAIIRNCENDIRCVKDKVVYESPGDAVNIIKQANLWLITKDENYIRK